MKKCFRISLFECILISFSLCFMIFLYGPTQIYISNALDFSFNIKDIWHYMLPLSVVSTAIGTFILTGIFRMNSKAGMFLAIICTGMLLAFFIEGNYLAAELPILDGNEIDWKDYNRSKTLSYVVWCICAFGSTICIIKIKQERIIKAVKWINTIVLLFMVITLLG